MIDTLPHVKCTSGMELTLDEYELIQVIRRIRSGKTIGTLMLTVEDTGLIIRESLPPRRVRRHGANIS